MPHDPAIRSVRMHQVLPGLYSFRAGVGPEPCSAQRDAKPKWLPSVDEHGIHLLATAAVRPNQARAPVALEYPLPELRGAGFAFSGTGAPCDASHSNAVHRL
jgi:hypothetical protein